MPAALGAPRRAVVPNRAACRRAVVVAVARKSAARKTPLGFGDADRSADATPRKCPCGSGAGYGDCCGPILAGAWARTAPELSRARFAALATAQASVLAETTHPESLNAIGTRSRLQRKMERHVSRWHGLADDHAPALIDCVHAASPTHADEWYVLLAVSFGAHTRPAVIFERYRKDGGRWWFMDELREVPALDTFVNFLDRYGGDDVELDASQLSRSLYGYSWLAVPPRRPPPPPPAAAIAAAPDQQQQQGPGRTTNGWLVDNWPDPDPGWVYLDTAVDPATGLTAAQLAALTRKKLDASFAASNPTLDWESFYFLRGRFMEAE